MKIKSLLIAVCITLAAFTASAQVNPGVKYTMLNTSKRALDTVTNTGTKSMTAHVPGGWKQVTIMGVNNNLTGAQSGIFRLYGSLDGVNYTRIHASVLRNSQVDSLILTTSALSKTYSWVIEGNPFQWYRLDATGIGTVTFTTAGSITAH